MTGKANSTSPLSSNARAQQHAEWNSYSGADGHSAPERDSGSYRCTDCYTSEHANATTECFGPNVRCDRWRNNLSVRGDECGNIAAGPDD